mgnify:CR=1 FL=1
MAVTGLPEPMKGHAVTMVRFAWDCRNEFVRVTKELEVSLGPDTADLAMRFGLHSGAVTAGVLRGDRARFQLFGDTVNTASRMESTGVRDRIQVSEATAELLRKAGKGAWLKNREDEVIAKGKGRITTYWAMPKSHATNSNSSQTSGGESCSNGTESQTAVNTIANSASPQPAVKNNLNQRLVDWMAEMLLDQTRKIMYIRHQTKVRNQSTVPTYHPKEGQTCMDEVKDIIEMPSYDACLAEMNQNFKRVVIPQEAAAGLREFVARVAGTYRDNPFHNFEHAWYVARGGFGPSCSLYHQLVPNFFCFFCLFFSVTSRCLFPSCLKESLPQSCPIRK